MLIEKPKFQAASRPTERAVLDQQSKIIDQQFHPSLSFRFRWLRAVSRVFPHAVGTQGKIEAPFLWWLCIQLAEVSGALQARSGPA
jgi:hypothetical protein